MKILNINIRASLFMLLLTVVAVTACKEEEEMFEQTRLFRPVLNEDLYSIGNTIVVDMGKMKSAVSYTLEVSRDTFNTVEYVIETDTAYVEINKSLIGEELFWNTLYQVRSTAHASDPMYDSKAADLGNVRTQRFPTILNTPERYDVTDVAARVTWTKAGAAVTGVKVFAADDLQLNSPLFDEQIVSSEEQENAEVIVEGLDPETEYQIAIYSEDALRGWVNYTTKTPDIDPTAPGVIDIRDNESPSAVADAVLAAADGDLILVKRGVTYDLPDEPLDKSITIQAAYGFGEQKAKLYTTGNWNIAEGAQIDHIRFIDLEIRGEDYSGDYVFNPNTEGVNVREVLFDNCEIGTVRGIFRIRGTVALENFVIRNTLVDSVGSYGILTTDTNPSEEEMTAHVDNILLENSTFNKIQNGITSRNNSISIIIDSCTFGNFIKSGNRIFRYRGGDGNNDVKNGISITNSIFGHGWDESESENYAIRGMEGLENTTFNIVNNYSTGDFSFSDGEIPGFPIGNYSGGQADLWVNPDTNDFNFKDNGFAGRFDTGAQRWRVVL
ncbi:DUF4957 domain-containing protein [Algoriphagus halophytocola]|uniref:DUF4957 domain-containing protein n=1 Tax=Algoriphagus halophytocola TaxID=2991499 RepID=A0ABY6MMY4_9BACT|nr:MULTISPECIES: DUF4957 domain-containing protein [unclassified Algoriphagus]UZD24520.1 DUF4957 domain-containing protein [Algoriphagus sp. TR-M5]WBL41884.1 DUF4957 domain-containing protein [Algoriphagus sp. TR-M9]